MSEDKKTELYLKLFSAGEEKQSEEMIGVQDALLTYLLKLQGRSSRQQAEDYNQHFFPKSISHTTMNEKIQLGELYFRQLYFLLNEIEVYLNKDKKLAKVLWSEILTYSYLIDLKEKETAEHG